MMARRRRRRPLSERRRRALPLTVLSAAAAVVLALVLGLYLTSSARDAVKFKATFIGTVGIYPGSDVRMLGVRVGKIDSVEPRGAAVEVTMQINADVPAAADTGAVVLSPSLVSDRYVQLTHIWTAGPKLSSGAVIPLSKTATPVELDQLYSSILDLTTALGPKGANSDGSLSRLLDTSAANLNGNGTALNQTITGLSGATSTLDATKEDLFATVDNLAQFTTTLSQNDSQVADLNTRLAAVTQVLAQDRQTFGAALSQLSGALQSVQGFIHDNRAALTTDVDRLASITKVLVTERDSLNEALRLQPLLVSNLINAYDSRNNVLAGRQDLNEFTIWPGAAKNSTPASPAAGLLAPAAVSSAVTAQSGSTSSVTTTAPAGSVAPPLLLPTLDGPAPASKVGS